MRDFIEPHVEPDDMLKWSKYTTILWGLAITGLAFLVGGISDTVVQAINMVGSVFYGPILAAFVVGILDRRSRGPAVITGVFVGVAFNCVLWAYFGKDLFWMWWNIAGLIIAVVVTLFASRLLAPPDPAKLENTTLAFDVIAKREKSWIPTYMILVAYFGLILLTAAFSQDILGFFR